MRRWGGTPRGGKEAPGADPSRWLLALGCLAVGVLLAGALVGGQVGATLTPLASVVLAVLVGVFLARLASWLLHRRDRE
jgi:tetrahydromethanopterin S-methyltransferase subunit C